MIVPPFDAPKWIAELFFDYPGAITPAVRRVVIHLADLADDAGELSPTRRRLAEACELSNSMAGKIVAALISAGWLIVVAEGRGPIATRFRLVFPPDPKGSPCLDFDRS